MALQEGDVVSLKVPLCWWDPTPVSCSPLRVDEGTRCSGFASAHCLCRADLAATWPWQAAAGRPWTKRERELRSGLGCSTAKCGGAVPLPFPRTLLSWHAGWCKYFVCRALWEMRGWGFCSAYAYIISGWFLGFVWRNHQNWDELVFDSSAVTSSRPCCFTVAGDNKIWSLDCMFQRTSLEKSTLLKKPDQF